MKYCKKVKLKETSKFVDLSSILDPNSSCNPINISGDIIGFDKNDPEVYLHVLWENGLTNWYALEDLEQV